MTLTTQLNETGLTFSDVAAHMGVRDLGLLETGCVFLPGQWGQQLGENQPRDSGVTSRQATNKGCE
jgi:hypothetical protein